MFQQDFLIPNIKVWAENIESETLWSAMTPEYFAHVLKAGVILLSYRLEIKDRWILGRIGLSC
jgi:hypothetical protein